MQCNIEIADAMQYNYHRKNWYNAMQLSWKLLIQCNTAIIEIIHAMQRKNYLKDNKQCNAMLIGIIYLI